MKKTFAALAAGAMILALASCQSTAQEAPDSYDDGTEAVQQEQSDKAEEKSGGQKVTKIKWNTKANREAAMAGDPYNQKKMLGNRGFGERLININKFTKIEPCSAYLKPTVGKMFLRKGNLIYREGTDVGGFEMYYDSTAYALQFAQGARAIVRNAVSRYLEDFDEKRLDRNAKTRATREAYGFCEGYEDYGVISGMMTYYSRPKVFCGYMFVNKTPYFTLNVKRAQNLAVNEKTEEGSLKATTIEQTYYFTKAQASKLAAFLSDENIGAMQAATTPAPISEEVDDYGEPEPKVQER